MAQQVFLINQYNSSCFPLLCHKSLLLHISFHFDVCMTENKSLWKGGSLSFFFLFTSAI